MRVRYRPGRWVAVTGPRTWLLVDADPDAPLVARCWALARAGADELELVGAIAAAGLRTVGGFAAAGYTDGTGQVIVHGPATVTLTGTDGTTRTLTANHVTTWVETRLDTSLATITLSGPAADGPALPLDVGVALAGDLAVELTPQTLAPPAENTPPTAAPEPAEVAEQEPAPERAPVPEQTASVEQAPVPEVITSLPLTFEPAAPTELAVPPAPAEPPTSSTPPGHAELAEPAVPLVLAAPAEPTVPPALAEQPPQAAPRPSAEPLAPAEPAAAQVEGTTTLVTGLPVKPEDTEVIGGTTAVITHLPWVIADDPGVTRARPALTTTAPLLVPAIRCDSGHWNPPHAVACRVCGAGLPLQQPVEVPRPPLGALRLSSGDLVQLDRGVLLGRAPDAAAVNQPVRPHMVRLRSPDGDVSRNHVEVRLHGWQVLVLDLGSRNGTEVRPPADLPFALVPHQPVEIAPGTVVGLAEGVEFVFEVTG
ncbi:FHA domain-containing protein [Actinokineospora cianjurensis]|uniref:FHA domain-containing protein n=1 Tax=Actinokineospora cianjurensis TaxID=585224 RepID=A0A421B5T2_9PSEU|nr:FHA domain-containing protein [Actinokineospora cianjurensis]RLK59781.1 FHA domain-containing protein [Actinokineospora cianjurensis]